MRDSRGPYPSDLSDAEWALLAPLLPPPAARGRPRKWPPRLVADPDAVEDVAARVRHRLERQLPQTELWPPKSRAPTS